MGSPGRDCPFLDEGEERKMQELIQNILATVDKKGVQRDGKKILKKCSMKSAKDTGYVIELAVWLYVYGHDREAAAVCGLLAGETFSGNYTLWDNIDHACCLKARILREQGNLEESRQIIRRVNRHRHPELYGSGVEWFTKTIDDNIRNSLVNNNSEAEARGWRLLKLEKAIAYREAGQYPLTDDELERIIAELKDVLSHEK